MAEAGRRDLIVDAARRLFPSSGYDATTFGGIATELDLSKAAVGYYFPTKESFLVELVKPLLDALERAISNAHDAEGAAAAYLDTLLAEHDIAVWLDTDPFLQSHPDYGGRLAAINDGLMAKLQNGKRSAASRVRALTTLGGIWRPVRTLRTGELRKHRDSILAAALAGAP